MTLAVPIRQADMITRPKLIGVGLHYGIRFWLWNGEVRVLDFQSDSTAREVSEAEFAEGRRVTTRHQITDSRAIRSVWQRVQRFWRNHGPFDIAGNNCEHAARYVMFGHQKSDQIAGLLFIGVIALVVVVAAGTRRAA